MLIEIGELLYDVLSGSTILFACAYVVGKVIDLAADVIKTIIYKEKGGLYYDKL